MTSRLTDWKPGDPLAASHWQEVVEALRPLAEQQRGGGGFLQSLLPGLFKPSNNAFPRLCIVTNAGPANATGGGADFTDARYWIKWAIPSVETRCGEADSIEIAEEEEDQDAESSFSPREAYPAVATNIAELSANSHLLPTDESIYAWAIPVWDWQEEPQRHWLIDCKPSAPLFVKVSGNTQDGTNKRWAYTGTPVRKNGAAYAAGSWETYGATSITFYNLIEYQNAATGTWGNGISSTNLAGTALDILPIPTNTVVRVDQVGRANGGSPEYWTSYENGVDGACS